MAEQKKTTETADSAMLAAVKQALNGGRTFGGAQHKAAIWNLAQRIVSAAENDGDVDVYVDAIAKIGNLSALQQKLEKAGVIDRQRKEAVKANIFAALKA